MSTPTPWTPQEDALLTEKYRTCKSVREVMTFFPHRTYDSLRSRAKDHLGIRMKKVLTHNRTFFAVPNEVNCSIAGFLAADGCVSDIGRLTVTLASKDREHVEAIVQLLEFSGKIYDYTRPYNVVLKKHGKEIPYSGILKTSTIQIQCPELCTQLYTHWNITPRKTHTLQPPNLTDPRLIMAYPSGLIDGDGWIIEDRTTPERPQYSISVMGTKELMTWAKTIFDQYVPRCDGASLQPNESENIYDYKVSSVKTYWLAKMFFSLPVPRLERKWGMLRTFVERVDRGEVSSHFKTSAAKCRPSDEILGMFGLLVPPDNSLSTSPSTTTVITST